MVQKRRTRYWKPRDTKQNPRDFTKPYLNLRAASRNSMICITCSLVGLQPEFLKEVAGNAMVGERYFAARIDKRVDVLNGIYKLPRVAEKCTDPWRNQGIVSDVLVQQVHADDV